MADGTFDCRLYNIIVLGFAFMFIFTAFQTCSMVEEAVLTSADNGTFEGDGYKSQGIVYVTLSVSTWAAPAVIDFAGPKISMVFGSSLYVIFTLSFLKPMLWSLFTGSFLVGLGAAILWTAQGSFLTLNSDPGTIRRNSGIFWALFQLSLLFGNMYTFFVFRGENSISDTSRTRLFLGLSGAGLLGVVTLLFLRKPPPRTAEELSGCLTDSSVHLAMQPMTALKKVFHLFRTKKMLILCVPFVYTGMELTFLTSVYGTCIAQNEHFGKDREGLLGISGMLIGAGEIVGGVAFGLLRKKSSKYGRDPIVLLGYVLHAAVFYMTFLNLPMDSPIRESSGSTYISSSEHLALLGSFLLGFGDASIVAQIISLIGFTFTENSSSAFALYYFVQSVTAAAAFYYSSALLLQWQLLILVVMGMSSVLCFSSMEWESTRRPRSGYQALSETQHTLARTAC